MDLVLALLQLHDRLILVLGVRTERIVGLLLVLERYDLVLSVE